MGMATWKIERADEGSEKLSDLLRDEGNPWEPFAVTTESRLEFGGIETYQVVWLRRR